MMPIPWAAILQAAQLGMQASKMFMDRKKGNSSGDEETPFQGRVLQGRVSYEDDLGQSGQDGLWDNGSYMERIPWRKIPQVAGQLYSKLGLPERNNQLTVNNTDIAPVAPGAGISATPMNLPPVPRMPFEGRSFGVSSLGSSEPDFLRLRDILTRYRLR
ncbi:MAG: hypothetical protein K2X01_11435 [Cyanobacteria bacterium]|nr:hypothetical protein [Cyanobacteriota bacterium]